jgi:hypothetical protein
MTFNESCKFLSRFLVGDYKEKKVKKSKKTNNKKKET